MSPAQDPGELLPVVDDQDRQVGLASRSQVHGQGLLHRAVHVLLFDLDDNLWLQRRSQAKDTYPGMWTSSASGHLDPGEDYYAAAQRELREELGLSLELT
ncbi:MAG: NUDIX domain-containing protein [Pseudomonadota bacterium]